MATSTLSAREEWRAHAMVPVAAGLGYATSVIHIYGIGPYFGPIAQEFGWSRTEVTFGLTIATLVQAVGGVFIGLAVDRFGPRRFGVVGLLMIGAAFALLGTADGSLVQWYLLWSLIALAALPVQASVWTSAVASLFHVSRGMAFAVTLCGASIAAGVFPLVATYAISEFGWRAAFSAHAGVWLLAAFPVIFLFFHGRFDRGRKAPQKEEGSKGGMGDMPGVSLSEGLRSSIYHRLFVASLLFTFTIIAIVVHFTAILGDQGADPLTAAAIASFVGWFSLAGRLGTGLLLDRFPASLVGAAVFMLPVAGCLLLLFFGTTYVGMVMASALIGLTLGAEIDVVVFLLTRHFGLKNFGGLYGGVLAALSVGTAVGPLAAARIFDVTGSYTGFLWLALASMTGSSLAIGTLPRRNEAFAGH
ncbi:MFS transporter [Novosphingobium mangrovi (ex Huang et al. 2023)]|uniref:MFS transporter n=1 Tax=Novosphingobium mangrovi (ex Huang et al. 2023) TaxID=2976432 RepID=A0ABT2I0I5_9SPHN|nr:MFS transporter [Novosphingobium mangrovi (ex Huang et al. 2023)]MCT2398310.1 MFS transporter [Novosphingobium mangrovi (ex Huang et al. 2023)]